MGWGLFNEKCSQDVRHYSDFFFSERSSEDLRKWIVGYSMWLYTIQYVVTSKILEEN